MASILVVCTGNVCRSPMAEGFLRNALQTRFGAGAPLVASVGVAGWEGSPAMAESVKAAAERDTDIANHVAHRLRDEHLSDATLVVCMAAEHSDAIGRMAPDAAGRTFTLKELVRLLEELPARGSAGGAGEQLSRRVEEADNLRRSGFSGNPHDEDIMDPLGMPLESYRAVAWELDEWCRRLADALFGRAPARAPVARGE